MKISIVTTLLAASIFAAHPASAQEDINKLYSEAAAQWRDGRTDDAAGALKYVAYRSTIPQVTSAAVKDLVVLLAEAGKNSETLPYLTKGAIQDPDDFYYPFELGWNLLNLEKDLDARAAFEKAMTLTADPALISQARFGLALAEARLSGPDKALEVLRAVYTKHPFLLAPAAQLMSYHLEKSKRRPHALNFMKESLDYDPSNIQAEIDLASLYEKTGFHLPAWQTYYTLHDLDPEEPEFRDRIKKLAKRVKGKMEDLLYWRRMGWPVHREPMDITQGPAVSMGLYASAKGVPASLTEFTFICASDLELLDARLGVIMTARAGTQWHVSFNKVSRLFEVRDNLGSSVRTSANSLRLVPKTRGAVILVKNPGLPPGTAGIDRGDKEVAGELQAALSEEGFWLRNEAPAEAFVSPITASLSDKSRQIEFLRAVSVTVRSRLAWLAAANRHDGRAHDLCDSSHCLNFPGMQGENEASAEAARATRGVRLLAGGAVAPAELHRACGGRTEEGINDSGGEMPLVSPYSLYDRAVNGPREGMLCLPEDKTAAADVTWTLLLRPKWIESRLNRTGKVGYLKALVPLRRSPDGRVLSMRAEGTAGTMSIEGEGEINRALAAGTLRSTRFSIRPIYSGSLPEFFLIRGIGTGDGKGLCVLGAKGMAARQGASYSAILARYFPGYKIIAPELPKVPSRPARPVRRKGK